MLQLTTIFFLIAFSTLAVIHHIAITLFLYWRLPWFDIPMHAFGGVVVALGLYTLRDLRLFPDKILTIIPVMLIVLAIALIWEGFEFFAGIAIEGDYFLDTSIDIMMGLIGGVVGYVVGNSIRSLH